MQQIYTQSHEDFEVFTTVLSPQVCRKSVIFKHQGEMVVVTGYSAEYEDEGSVCAGEVVILLHREDADWCYVRQQNGREAYLPTTCFEKKQNPLRPIVTKQSSIQESSNDRRRCTGKRSLKLPRRASLSGVTGSPRLLQRLLTCPRRRSEGHAVHTGSINPAFQPE
ncbi:hypothetical protein E1301_Tti021078 [Triplophysa tibetana]|uniref:SH3 domain-containing protein n=1 Tax=Triplophysa tibetana TaxID=1572043 RepID=A0A5A9P9V7_9TELE|nr:hypothetical protein E1301_Tti021078 [Triplophysa tibetana]